ncbi:MAG: ATP synthase subunit I [Desulfatiglandaceae bacterium]
MLAEHREIIGFIKTFNWIALFVLGAASFLLMGTTFTSGLIFGGLLIILNFSIFERSIRLAFSTSSGFRFRKATAIVKYYIRLILMGVVIYILLKHAWVHPVGLLLGLSIVVISIIALGIKLLMKTFPREAA